MAWWELPATTILPAGVEYRITYEQSLKSSVQLAPRTRAGVGREDVEAVSQLAVVVRVEVHAAVAGVEGEARDAAEPCRPSAARRTASPPRGRGSSSSRGRAGTASCCSVSQKLGGWNSSNTYLDAVHVVHVRVREEKSEEAVDVPRPHVPQLMPYLLRRDFPEVLPAFFLFPSTAGADVPAK